MKRTMIATLMGLAMGVLCATVAFRGGLMKASISALVWVLLNRGMMGFTIGISNLKWHWAWNGIVLGVVVGSIFSYSLYLHEGDARLALMTPIGNSVYGFLIELFTSVVFRQRASARRGVAAQAMHA